MEDSPPVIFLKMPKTRKEQVDLWVTSKMQKRFEFFLFYLTTCKGGSWRSSIEKMRNIHRNHVKQKTGLKENISNKTTVRTLLGDHLLLAMQRCLN